MIIALWDDLALSLPMSLSMEHRSDEGTDGGGKDSGGGSLPGSSCTSGAREAAVEPPTSGGAAVPMAANRG